MWLAYYIANGKKFTLFNVNNEVRTKYEHTNTTVRKFVNNSHFGGLIKRKL